MNNNTHVDTPMKIQTFLLVDDHVIVREGVRRLLLDLPEGCVCVLEAGNGNDALAMFEREAIDIVLLDLNLEGIGGLELLRRMLQKKPDARIIIFSTHSEPLYAARALKLGAKGYVSKCAASDELTTAIRCAAQDGHYIERELASLLAVSPYAGRDPLQKLSAREIEILRYLGEARSMSEIAETLGISYKTVANTCSIMKTKLGVDRTADLIRTSIELFQG